MYLSWKDGFVTRVKQSRISKMWWQLEAYLTEIYRTESGQFFIMNST
jgi:hypothetical protein